MKAEPQIIACKTFLMLGKTRKRAYRSAVVILNVAIDLIAVHFMYHVVFSFVVIRVAYLRRNISRAVFAI